MANMNFIEVSKGLLSTNVKQTLPYNRWIISEIVDELEYITGPLKTIG